MSEHPHDRIEVFRETDRWLRRALVYAPILSFVAGWGSGVITSMLFIRNVARDVVVLQIAQKENEAQLKLLDQREQRIIMLIAKMWGIAIP